MDKKTASILNSLLIFDFFLDINGHLAYTKIIGSSGRAMTATFFYHGGYSMDRRTFIQAFGAGAASWLSLSRANASAYQSLRSLNQKYIRDNSPDGKYWEAVQKHFCFENDLVMMNNGTVGPIPEPVYNTFTHYIRIQAANPYDCYAVLPQYKDTVRQQLARHIHADTDEVAVTRNTTEGLNLAAHGLKLKSGDEVILSSHEHPAGIQPWRLRAARDGIKIVEAKLAAPPKSIDEIVSSFEAAITPRTRVISVSHTVYLTGLIVPVRELCEMAHRHDILVVADSAHGFGMLDLNMKSLDADIFVSSPYKWGFAPTGLGMLYVKKPVQDSLWPLIASSGWDTLGSAQRFETLGQRLDPLFFALEEAMKFQNQIGKKRIERRIKTLAGYLKERLHAIDRVRVHTPDDPYLSAGLTAFSIKGVDPEHIVNFVREKHNIVIRTIGRESDNTLGVRVSTPIYVNMDSIDRLLDSVRYLAEKRS